MSLKLLAPYRDDVRDMPWKQLKQDATERFVSRKERRQELKTQKYMEKKGGVSTDGVESLSSKPWTKPGTTTASKASAPLVRPKQKQQQKAQQQHARQQHNASMVHAAALPQHMQPQHQPLAAAAGTGRKPKSTLAAAASTTLSAKSSASQVQASSSSSATAWPAAHHDDDDEHGNTKLSASQKRRMRRKLMQQDAGKPSDSADADTTDALSKRKAPSAGAAQEPADEAPRKKSKHGIA